MEPNPSARTLSFFSTLTIAAWLLYAPFAMGASGPQEEDRDQDQDHDFSIQYFLPAPGPANFYTVESTEIGEDMKPTVGMFVYYQHRPLVLLSCDGDDCSQGTTAIDSVQNLANLEINGSFTFKKRFLAGLSFPITLYQRGYYARTVTDNLQGTTQLRKRDQYVRLFRLGELRLHFKGQIIGKEGRNGFNLAASATPILPLGYWTNNQGHWGSEKYPSGILKVITSYKWNQLRVAANLGGYLRAKSEFYGSQTGSSLLWGLAGSFAIIPQIEVMAELYGAKVFTSDEFTDLESWPMMFLGGGRFNLPTDSAGTFKVHVAGGGGIISGIGVPQFQVIAGLTWVYSKDKSKSDMFYSEWDVDGDGVDNEADACPEEPEDLDGFQDDDGCPENDNDNDGIDDGYDSCPNAAEDKDNYRDDDGCPDLDHDQDGVNSPADLCPDKPEDRDGFADEDGCPEEDNDTDGFLDAKDYCPDHAEDKDGYQDNDGCPEHDNDWDGVPDAKDKCANQKEVLNGRKDSDGCKDSGAPLIKVSKKGIALEKSIRFPKASDKITGRQSNTILDMIAEVIKGNPSLRVSIEGHTDNQGNAALNKDLSKRRAEAVMKYLVDKGIDAKRLAAVGHGPDKPIASNKTSKGRKKNNRIEFIWIHPRREIVEEEDDGMDFTMEGEEEEDEGMDFTEDEEGEEDDAEMDFTME